MQPVALKERALRAARNPSPSLACVGLLVDGSSVRAVSVERLVSSALCRCSARRTLSRDTACVLSGVGRGGCRRRRSCSPEPLRGRHFISVPLTESLCVAGGGFEATRSERDRPMTCSVTKREERVGPLLQVTVMAGWVCLMCLIAAGPKATSETRSPAVHGLFHPPFGKNADADLPQSVALPLLVSPAHSREEQQQLSRVLHQPRTPHRPPATHRIAAERSHDPRAL
jgi:hypothetical protein